MSRSYRKTPSCGRNNKGMKRFANKRVRHFLKDTEANYNGQKHKKIFCSYDIKDYGYLAPSFKKFCEHELSQWRTNPRWYNKHVLNKDSDKPPSEKELRILYHRWFKRK